MSSIVVNGDTSGSVTLSAPAIAGSVTVTLPASSGTMAVLPTATGVLAESAGGTGTTTGYYGFKNRIINGAMVINQRAGGTVTIPATTDTYTVDRWKGYASQASKFTVQQSTTAPTGYINSALITSSSAYTVGASEEFDFIQVVEGLNCTDLAWGTASAVTVTLSFWVRSSLTGTFGGSLRNSAANRSYPFSYTISSANTFEQKTITITGDTSGTWLTTNGAGIYLNFSMGAGSSMSATAGSWAAGNYTSATGATSVVGTNGATFYITGVQLEKGSTATSFDYRPYGTELALCQRYFEIIGSTANSVLFQTYAAGSGTANQRQTVYYKVSKRAAPTASIVGTWTYSNASNLIVSVAGIDATRYDWSASGAGITYAVNSNSGAYLSFDIEL